MELPRLVFEIFLKFNLLAEIMRFKIFFFRFFSKTPLLIFEGHLIWPLHMMRTSLGHTLVPLAKLKEVAFLRYINFFDSEILHFFAFFAIFGRVSCHSIWHDSAHFPIIISFGQALFGGAIKTCLIQIVYPSRRFHFQTCATSSEKTSPETSFVLLTIDRC